MSIDKKPEVGRFVFRDSPYRDGFCRLAGVITKVSKSRVYYKDERFGETFMSDYSVSAVCDTAPECERLSLFEKTAQSDLQALKAAQRVAFDALFTEVA